MNTPAGTEVGMWTTIGEPYRSNAQTLVRCRCRCGTEAVVNIFNAMRGGSSSCGCAHATTLSTPVGAKFNLWTLTEKPFVDGVVTKAKCRCDCGTEKIVRLAQLKNGSSKSCGCEHRKLTSQISRTHGESNTRLYRIWAGMLARCSARGDGRDHKNYGGRGIRVCREWRQYEAFREWALRSGYSDSLCIERKDVNGGYNPENCDWILIGRQARNRTDTILLTAFGETKSIYDWELDRRCKATASLMKHRIWRGTWLAEDVVSTPKTNRWRRQK